MVKVAINGFGRIGRLALRKFKIEQTDWSASDKTYANEMRENKLD